MKPSKPQRSRRESPPTEANGESGPQGERLAARFLEGLGWRIIRRNYRVSQAEIDLVADDGDEIVFVEVKTLKRSDFGEPEDRVERHKQRQVSRAALHFVKEHRLEGGHFRFDVVAVSLGGREPKIQHFPNAFEVHRAFRI